MVKEAATEFDSGYFEYAGAVLPCQMRPAVSPLHAGSGERLLMLALLADANNWIRGHGRDCQPVSFEDACDALGIASDALRERLFRLKCGRRPRPGGREFS